MSFEFCLNKSTYITKLSEECHFTRKNPVNLKKHDIHLFADALEYTNAPSELHLLNNIKILPKGWLYKRSTLLKESFTSLKYPSHRKRFRGMRKLFYKGMFPRRIKEGVWITDNWSYNYFHWCADALPRLYLASLKKPRLQLLLPNYLEGKGFITESLLAFGAKEPIFVSKFGSLLVSKLYFPSIASETGHFNEPVIREVANKISRHFAEEVIPTRRIYISRNKALMRHIENEEQIFPILEKYGFEIVHFETLTFSEQVKLMSECKTLIGPHGAGFVNMMFMPKNGNVMEIHPMDAKVNNCFFTLASAMKHNHFYIMADTVKKNIKSHLDNMSINPEEFEKNINLILKNN
ncbi:MAG: hypothetical protein COA52_18365 [Hyphomicrobiales bacterium]|nr:MAG: hypothetical protein COA52_18365 [Hyphomicrobiales bacterium]